MKKETFEEKSERLRGLYKAGRITHEEYEKWIFSEDPEFTPEILPEEELPMPPTESYRMEILDLSNTPGEGRKQFEIVLDERWHEGKELKSCGKGIFEQIREAEPIVLKGRVTAEDLREIAERIMARGLKR